MRCSLTSQLHHKNGRSVEEYQLLKKPLSFSGSGHILAKAAGPGSIPQDHINLDAQVVHVAGGPAAPILTLSVCLFLYLILFLKQIKNIYFLKKSLSLSVTTPVPSLCETIRW